jgi:hypothetical protein
MCEMIIATLQNSPTTVEQLPRTELSSNIKVYIANHFHMVFNIGQIKL